MFVRLEALPAGFAHCPVVNGFCENCRALRQFSVVSAALKHQKVALWENDPQTGIVRARLAWRSRFCRVCGWLSEPSETPGGSRQGKRQRIFELDHHQCVYCGSRNQLTLDHLVPRSRGGSDDLANLVTACEACNRHKANGEPARLQFGRFGSAAT